MSVSCECCVLSVRELCDGPIARSGIPTECGVSECDRETSYWRSRPTRAIKPRGRGGEIKNVSRHRNFEVIRKAEVVFCKVLRRFIWIFYVILVLHNVSNFNSVSETLRQYHAQVPRSMEKIQVTINIIS